MRLWDANEYNSPFSLVQALAWFALIKGARIPRWVCGSAAFYAPSMFAVYMYHSSGDGFSFLRTVESSLIDEMGLNTVVCHIVVAVGIFAYGVLKTFQNLLQSRKPRHADGSKVFHDGNKLVDDEPGLRPVRCLPCHAHQYSRGR